MKGDPFLGLHRGVPDHRLRLVRARGPDPRRLQREDQRPRTRDCRGVREGFAGQADAGRRRGPLMERILLVEGVADQTFYEAFCREHGRDACRGRWPGAASEAGARRGAGCFERSLQADSPGQGRSGHLAGVAADARETCRELRRRPTGRADGEPLPAARRVARRRVPVKPSSRCALAAAARGRREGVPGPGTRAVPGCASGPPLPAGIRCLDPGAAAR